MQVTAQLDRNSEIFTFLRKLEGPAIQKAAARGLNEHADEQRRQAVTTMSAKTGLPKGRVSGVTKVIRAGGGSSMTAMVRVADRAIGLHEYGAPSWNRDLSPKGGKGAVSSSAGAEATGWNRRKVYKGTFVAKGKVFLRKGDGRFPLKMLSGPVLANELSDLKKSTAPGAQRYAAMDLERRVIRHVQVALGA